MNFRNLIGLLSAVAAVSLSCTKEEAFEQELNGTATVKITISGYAGKAGFADGGFVWSSGDVISWTGEDGTRSSLALLSDNIVGGNRAVVDFPIPGLASGPVRGYFSYNVGADGKCEYTKAALNSGVAIINQTRAGRMNPSFCFLQSGSGYLTLEDASDIEVKMNIAGSVLAFEPSTSLYCDERVESVKIKASGNISGTVVTDHSSGIVGPISSDAVNMVKVRLSEPLSLSDPDSGNISGAVFVSLPAGGTGPFELTVATDKANYTFVSSGMTAAENHLVNVPLNLDKAVRGSRIVTHPISLSESMVSTNAPMTYVSQTQGCDKYGFGGSPDWFNPITASMINARRQIFGYVSNMFDGDASTSFHTNMDWGVPYSSWGNRSEANVGSHHIQINFGASVSDLGFRLRNNATHDCVREEGLNVYASSDGSTFRKQGHFDCNGNGAELVVDNLDNGGLVKSIRFERNRDCDWTGIGNSMGIAELELWSSEIIEDPDDPAPGPPVIIPDGFEDWPRVAYVFRDGFCEAVYKASSAAELSPQLDFKAGDIVSIVAYQGNADNVDFGLSAPGGIASEYRIVPRNKILPLPEMWQGRVVAGADNCELNFNMKPLTSFVELDFANVPADFDRVAIVMSEMPDAFEPASGVLSMNDARSVEFRISKARLGQKAAFFANSIAGGPVTFPVKIYYLDRYNHGSVSFEHGFTSLGTIKASVDFSDKGTWGDYSLTLEENDRKSGSSAFRTIRTSFWPHSLSAGVSFTDSGFEFRAGKNLAFWFGSGCSWSKGSGWADDGIPWTAFDYKSDIDKFTYYGFDHYRIPIDEECLWDKDGVIRPAVLEVLKKVVDYSISKGCRVIIDLHWLKIAQWFPNEESEIHYKHCWKDLHDVFKDYDPAWLAYELLNESGSHVEGYWNGFVANSIDMVRSWGGNERNRLIICGCDSGNDVSACSTMELPKSDPNLVLNFHSYYPTYFTFYKSGFDDDYGFAGYDGPVHYPGRVVTDAELAKLSPDQYARTHWFRSSSFDYYSMRSHLKAAYDAGIRLGKRVYCGEYGAQELSGINDRIAWFRDRARIYDEFDMAYATWFGLANTENHPDANKDIIKAVTGKDI